MHQTNDQIRIGENAKVTQHDTDLENDDEGDDEENLEAPHLTIISVNFANKNACICPRENVLECHTRSWPRSSFSPFGRNCKKKRRIFNHCDQVYLQTTEHIQELYIYPCVININQMPLIGQLMRIFTPGK